MRSCQNRVVVTLYEARERNQNFGQVEKAYVRVVNNDNGRELVRFDLPEDYSREDVVTIGELFEKGDSEKAINGFAAGLGVGALVVRTVSIHIVRTDQLAKLPYLEHGANWAIGVLASLILASIFVSVPEWGTGLVGVLFIGASIWSSRRLVKANGESMVETLSASD